MTSVGGIDMKYNIMGFDQAMLLELGLDIKDAAILRYFIDFRDTKKMRCQVIDAEPYYWVKYEAIIEEYPILGLKSADSVYNRFKKLVAAKVLKHKTVKSNGVYSYYSLGEGYMQLISSSKSDEDDINKSDENLTGVRNPSERVSDENQEGVGRKSGTNNPSTKYPYKKEKVKKEKNQSGLNELMEAYTDNPKLRETILDFIKMRKAIKKPITDKGLALIFNKLDKYSNGSDDYKIAMLENSIENSWQGVFELKDADITKQKNQGKEEKPKERKIQYKTVDPNDGQILIVYNDGSIEETGEYADGN